MLNLFVFPVLINISGSGIFFVYKLRLTFFSLILRDNFLQLRKQVDKYKFLQVNDLVIDIGANDGNLLNNFKSHYKVLGVTPEIIGNLAIKRGIPTIIDYFDTKSVNKILKNYGKAKLITATNVFAHIAKVNKLIKNIKNKKKKILYPAFLYSSSFIVWITICSILVFCYSPCATFNRKIFKSIE